MKRFWLLLTLFVLVLFTFAQQTKNQMLWFNGKIVHSATIEIEDSAILGTVWETDTVQLLLPRALVQIQYDTVVVVDTVIKVIRDTINHYYTKVIHDTLVVNNFVEIDAATSKKYQGIHYFSVGTKKKVLFSRGNLQYNASTLQWRFAENQYDIIGKRNANIGPNNTDWIDLFGWGTRFPTNNSLALASYGSYIDWGSYSIGSDAPRTWRTLTQEEWVYLLEERTNARSLYGVAQVAGVNGIIILPDLWTTPNSIVFKSGMCMESGAKYIAKHQTFDANQWKLMEDAGAIFLPVTGYRYESDVLFVDDYGKYWTSTDGSSSSAASIFFYSSEITPHNFDSHCRGLAVRLVKDI